MVKHIVIWRVKGAGPEQRGAAERIKSLLESMAGKIPGLLKIEAGINFLQDPNAADVALYCELADRAALALYQEHPVHVAVKPQIGALTSERRVVDYDC